MSANLLHFHFPVCLRRPRINETINVQLRYQIFVEGNAKKKSLSLLGVGFDRNLEQTLFIAEKLRSTVAVLVVMGFFRFMSFIKLAHLFLLIGSLSLKSILALDNSSLRTDLLMSKESKCSTR